MVNRARIRAAALRQLKQDIQTAIDAFYARTPELSSLVTLRAVACTLAKFTEVAETRLDRLPLHRAPPERADIADLWHEEQLAAHEQLAQRLMDYDRCTDDDTDRAAAALRILATEVRRLRALLAVVGLDDA